MTSVNQPIDKMGATMPLLPAIRAKASTRNTTLSTSAVEFTLATGTTLIRVKAKGADVYINFTSTATDTVTASSFDMAVFDGETVDLALPVGTDKINAITSSGTVSDFIILEY